jgi:hypothetical protein
MKHSLPCTYLLKPNLLNTGIALFFLTGIFSSTAQVNATAIASYGLRKISTSYTGNAVQVRRCDGATKNIGFTSCGELDTASLKTFAMQGSPLSSMTAASAAAFSLRKLSCSYSGNAIRVRRSNDNTEQDIGFTIGGDLDTAAAKTFVGANSGFVVTWYDQSGNARNATQTTQASQPRIINAGIIDRHNGMPAIYFPGTNTLLNTTLTAVQATTSGNITTANFVMQSEFNTAGTILSNGDAGSNRYNIHMPWSDHNTYFDIGDIATGGRLNTYLDWPDLNVGTFIRNGASVNVWKNGVNVMTSGTMASTVTSANTMSIGGSVAFGSYMRGYIAEISVFPSALSTAERQFLEWNQSEYYNFLNGTFSSSALPGVLPGATVATWYDQSGNSRNLTQAVVTQQPSIMSSGTIQRLRGLPTILGSNALQTDLTATIGAAYTGTRLTALAVTQADVLAPNGNRRIISFSTGTAAADWNLTAHFNVNQRGGTGNEFHIERVGVAPSTTIAALTPLTLTALFDGTNRMLYNNGTVSATTADANTFNYTHFRLFNSINPGFTTEGFTGRISEFTLFHPTATAARTTRRILVESAEAAYYGLTIAAAGDKFAAAPATHNMFVNGIGRESASDTVLSTRNTMGMGVNATTAAGNFLVNTGDYIMIGTSCPFAGTSTANLAAPAVLRWAADWYMDKTDAAGNTGGTVTVYFDFSDYGVSTNPTTAANYRLLYRAGTAGNYAAATISGTTTISGDRVVFTTNATNLADGYYTLGTINVANSPLPVELTTFEGTSCEKNVCLNWETATELNNSYFSVRRSNNARDFETVGKVASKAADGNSNQGLNYAFKDTEPLSGTSYYQLEQFDINGDSKKSGIISVQFDAIRNVSFVVYPNPNSGEFSVDFSGLENNHELQITVLDLQGRTAYRGLVDRQDLSFNTFRIIPDKKISNGTYLIVFEMEGIKYTSKIVVE